MFNKRHSNVFGLKLNEKQKVLLKNIVQDLIKKCYNRGFKNGVKCPKCGNTDLNKNGITSGRQRYICKKCRITFDERSFSPFSNTKLSLDKWLKYCQFMIEGGTIRQCAEQISVSVPTSFFMRHKILDIMNASLKNETLSGIVSSDACYMNESFKGAHIKDDDIEGNLLEYDFLKNNSNKYLSEKYFASFDRDKLPGSSFFFDTCLNSVRNHEKNIKKNQICINTAIDKNGHILTRVVDNKFGVTNNKIKSQDIVSFFNKRVGEKVILCVYTMWLYRDIGIKLRQSPRAKAKIYTVNHVYKYHWELKRWMSNFNGVATKYLNNYLAWFKLLFVENKFKLFDKIKNFIDLNMMDFCDTKEMIQNRCIELL